MNHKELYDCAIVGGGLSGLCLAIQLTKMDHSVILFEKNRYPFHKVCGEYISMESWNFIENLGIPLSEMNLPQINRINITAENGFMISSELAMGGFGVSRFLLENELLKVAIDSGVHVKASDKVQEIRLNNETYQVSSFSGVYQARVVCGSYGKLKFNFTENRAEKNKQKYMAVKYHIKTDLPDNIIELHNFKDGYCGISRIENKQYCLCYLTTLDNLKQHNHDIKKMEKNMLSKNPFLKQYFENAEFLFDKPLTISQISFKPKQAYQNDMFMLGDAAGAIAPLCGNGMSMAMRSSKILADLLNAFFSGQTSKKETIQAYKKQWDVNFRKRIRAGYYLQFFLGKKFMTFKVLQLLEKTPALFRKLIALTHGNSF